MKFISILLSLASLSVSAQNSQWLWPIEGDISQTIRYLW